MNKTTQNILLLLGVVFLAAIPMVIHSSGGAQGEGNDALFTGSDGQAEELITKINPEYEPWFHSVWEPPSGEIESLLFALQAAIGSGVLFYCIGYYRGKRSRAAGAGENVA